MSNGQRYIQRGEWIVQPNPAAPLQNDWEVHVSNTAALVEQLNILTDLLNSRIYEAVSENLASIKADKARLDWLNTQCNGWMQRGGKSGLEYSVRCEGRQDVRQAIDAAMKVKGGKQ